MMGFPMTKTIRVILPFAGCFAAAALAGCTSSSEVPAPPRPTVQAVVVGPRALPPRTAAESARTGVYPGFSEVPKSAGTQMSVEEADKMQASLTRLTTARNSGKISEAEYRKRLAELRDLAANHGANAEAAIAR